MRNIFTLCLLVFTIQMVYSQRGLIVEPAVIPVTQPNPMDPNKDGYITKGTQQPFSGTAPYTGYYVPEFEFKMFGLPKIGSGDVPGDNFTGPSCGLSDVAPDLFGYSVYAHKTATNELVFRFRLGKDANSIQSWQVLVDTDGLFGNGVDPNWNASNPGFELNFSLVTRNNPGVFITNVDGQSGCSNPIKFYSLTTNFQKAIADVETCGDPDIFYDFFIDLQDLYTLTNVTPTTQLRFAASTSQATGCAFSGGFADISGVDNTNPLYSSPEASFAALTDSQCPTQLNDLCETCPGFAAGPTPPTINTPTLAGATTITGTAGPGIFVKILVYERNGGTDLEPTWSTTPRDSVVVTASGTGQWSANLLTTTGQQPDILKAFDKIVGASLFTANGNDCTTADYVVTTTVTVVEPNVAPVAQSQSVTTNEDTAKPITLVATDADADNVLSYSVVTQPTKGTLSCLTCSNPVYTPNANYFGPDSFTFRAYDGALFSNTATVTITVNSVNDIPVANNQTLSTAEDTPLAITLTATDVETTSLTYVVATQPANGTLTGSGASLTYTPNANFNGSDSFTFTASDGTDASPAATISITVTPVPDAPVAQAQTVTTDEDTPKAITLVATDADGNTLTYAIASQPANGTVSLAGNIATYTPALNFNGSDSFTFTANDGTATSSAATVSITINPVNDAPVANAQAVTTAEDTPKSITLTASDVDGNTLTYSIIAQPQHGTLTVTGSNVTYTPEANYFGADAFTFNVNDGTVNSNTATVSITVTSVNDTPVAQAQSVTTAEDTPKTITLAATDADGDALTYSLVTSPSNGTATLSGNVVSYSPGQNFNGSDSFTFKANDGTVDSSPATVSITVTPVNDAPIANAQSVTTNEDTAAGITLTASDVDGDVLTYTVLTQPTRGVLSGTGPNLTYTPNANANGSDSFTFRVNDGTVNSNTATVSITITPVNDAPAANNQSVTTNEDVAASITLTGTDVEGSTLTYTVLTQPANGTLSGTAPNLTYTPNANYNGSDSFTFKVNDGTADSNTATVSITVTAVNDAPVANNQSVTTDEDTAASITLTGSDVEGSTLTYTVLTQPTKGVLSGTAPNLTYTPNANANGSDSFTFSVNDGSLNSNTATVSITITPVNDAPVANDQSVTTNEDVSASITLTGTDVEGSTLTYTVLTQPANGSLSGTAPNLTYTPNANYNGSDSFTFKVNDGTIDSNTATVSITITPVNDAPVANSQSITTNEDTAASITLTGSDVDGDALTYTVATQPTKGVLSGTAPNLTYTPNSNANGSDSFTFRVNDGTVNSTTATVSITITPVNDAPVANDQSVTTNEDVAKVIQLTATDVEGSTLTWTIVSQPTNGTLTGTAPNVTYTPNSNYNGSDSFTFKVNDGTADSNTATVSITVTPVNDAPVAFNETVVYQAWVSPATATPVNFVLDAEDVEGNPLTYTITQNLSGGVISGTAPNLTFTPNENFSGTETFTFKVNDGFADSNTATVTLIVSGLPAAPVAFDGSATTLEDTGVQIILQASDANGDPLTYTIVSGPTNGTVSTGNGALRTYTPAANFNGTDTFTFKANDGSLDSNIATITITISSVNDAPVALAQSVDVIEDTPKSIALIATDVDNDPLTYVVVTQPSKGTLSGTLPNLTYTPNANYNGSDSFTFKASDGTLESGVVTVSINVTPVNDQPVANSQTVTTDEDTQVVITLTGSDIDGDALTYIVGTPANGTLSGTAPNLVYTPNLNYNGPDSFTFTVNDGTSSANATSASATVSITVTPVNDGPVADNQTITTDEDTSKNFTLTGSDVDLNTITYTVLTQPTKGTLSGTAPNLTYTPNANANGSDSFTFKVNDGLVDSNTATISITITPVNDKPVANPQSVTTAEDTQANITLTGSDLDGNPLTYSVVTGPTNGTLSGTAPNLVYTPNLNYNGPDTFTFKVNDGTIDSDEATVSITVTPVNDAPIANNQTVTTNEDTQINITLTGSDVDGDILTFTLETQPTKGILSGTGANLSYTPNGNANGSDSFTFTVKDPSNAVSNTATVTINITPVNDKPVANAQSVTTNEDTQAAITLTGSDIDNDPLTYTIVSQPAHGALSGSAPNLIYTPSLNYNGSDSFTFKVNDGTIDSDAATVSIVVTPVNDAPVASDRTVSTLEDQTLLINLSNPAGANDVDGNPLTYAVVTPPTNGTLTGTAPNFTFTPNADFNGQDSFTFKANDGTVDSNTATVTINVTPVNDPPVADNQSVTTAEDTQLTINLVASDIDNDPLTYTAGNPAHGTLSCNDCANPVYTPALNYNGSDSFTFKVNDGSTDSNTATVSITVTPVNDKPIANNQSVTTNEDTPKVITLTGSDVEGSTLTYSIVSGPTEGTLSGTGNTLTYTPNTDNFGPDSFTFTVSDGELTSDPATISINILSVNDNPVASNDSGTALEDNVATVNLTTNDTDKDGNIDAATVDLDPSTATEDKTLTVSGKGTFSVDNTGVVTFTPVANFNGAVNITYTVKDNESGLSNEAAIAITITPVNDPPTVNVQNSSTDEDTQSTICFTVSDIEGDPVTFTSGSSQFGTGTVVPNPTAGPFCFTYTPNPDFNGTETIVIGVCDSNDPNVCNTGTITITVNPVNDAPVVIIDNQPVSKLTQTTSEDTQLDFCFTASDTEGDNISIANISTSANGTLTEGTSANGQLCLSFTPTGNFNGLASFTITLTDDGSPTQTTNITVEVTVTPVNDTPVAADQSVSVVEDTAKPITLVGTDIDLDPLSYIIVVQPQHGTLSGSGANLTYTPAANYNGPDSFTFKANDGTTDSNIGTVSITVTPVNDPPILNYSQEPMNEDGTKSVCIGIVEPDGDNISYSPNPLNLSGGGTLVYNPQEFCFLFTPTPDFNGNSEWQIEVCDSGSPQLCTTIKITIPVLPVNDPPVAVDDEIEAESYVETEFINIIDNDTDIDEDPLNLTITLITPPSHGTVIEIAPGGTIRYQSDLGYIGPDSFEYQVCDDKGACDTGLVTIDVGPPPFRIYQGLSPNGDQKNDYWRIDGIEAHPENRVRVFDRYNNLVFDQRNYDNDTKAWTGKSNTGITSGELAEGTYYYFVDLLDTKAQYTGFVVLKKN